jgi:hypothetical protein
MPVVSVPEEQLARCKIPPTCSLGNSNDHDQALSAPDAAIELVSAVTNLREAFEMLEDLMKTGSA